MSQLHNHLAFTRRPITAEEYLPPIKKLLDAGVPATYTLEQVAAFEQGREDEDHPDASNTTPLHIMARSLPHDLNRDEEKVVLDIMNLLFEYGAGWIFLDYEQKTVGDLLLERGQKRQGVLYSRLVDAGVSAELLLRKVNEGEIEFIDPEELQESPEETSLNATQDAAQDATDGMKQEADTAVDQKAYLDSKLEYMKDSLVTNENRDGVMMDWETSIMYRAADSICPVPNATVLNIGFGMGIIDQAIQSHHPQKHYICEAHPDVLQKMKQDGWYELEGVIVLEGRWQDCLNNLLDRGDVFFDGIYYDTFSEHYDDMLELYDVVVGLLKPGGVFSFFNGLGADRSLCYDVYKNIVELDVSNYGLRCEYDILPVGERNWEEVKRSYFNCDYYYHPRISFV
ncbi:probable Arginine N-methyltransferase 2 [Zygosaccharomyces bailii ISA1307]|nr:probable Arginine N-methyltransferase 2 [Zygosaccharomyces bailii ISA1307]